MCVVDCRTAKQNKEKTSHCSTAPPKIHRYILSARNLGVLLLLGTAADFGLIFSHSPSHRSAAHAERWPAAQLYSPHCGPPNGRDTGGTLLGLACTRPKTWKYSMPARNQMLQQRERQRIDITLRPWLSSIFAPTTAAYPLFRVFVFWALGHLQLNVSPDSPPTMCGCAPQLLLFLAPLY